MATKSCNSKGRPYNVGIALSDDIRNLIVLEAQEAGGNTCDGSLPRGVAPKIATKYEVSNQTVRNIWDLFVSTGQTTAKAKGRPIGPNILNEDDLNYIQYLIQGKPTISLEEIHGKLMRTSANPKLQENGISISRISHAIRNYLPGGKMTLKKVTHVDSHRYTEGNLRYIQQYIDFVSQTNPLTLKYMDEAGVCVSTGRRNYGHSVIGERCIEISRHIGNNRNYTVNLLVGVDGTNFCRVLEGSSNTEEYINFISEAVRSYNDNGNPVLKPGDILLVDNLSYHHNEGERILCPFLAQHGIQYGFTPRYSPFFNPVEECFSQLKSALKSLELSDLLHRNVPLAVHLSSQSITNDNIINYYRNTGVIDI